MWYFCTDCGNLFEDGEEGRYTDTLDYIDRDPYQEPRTCCPVCGGDFVEAEICSVCGSANDPDKMIGKFCPECLEEQMTPEIMKKYISLDLENFAEWLSDSEFDE